MTIASEKTQELIDENVSSNDWNPIVRQGEKLYLKFDRMDIKQEKEDVKIDYYLEGKLAFTQNVSGNMVNGNTLSLEIFEGKHELIMT